MRDSQLRAGVRRLLGRLGRSGRAGGRRRASLSCFDAGSLTRSRRRVVDPRALVFAAVDLETTGLRPGVDRVCEVGVVRFRADGRVLDEYATLLDPQGPMGATSIHGIAAAEVHGAPTFAEIAPELERLLAGTVVVAHNLPFDDAFLAAEFRRAGRPVPRWPGLCTLVTARAQLAGSGFGLAALHRSLTAAAVDAPHTALGDCRATAEVLAALLAQAPTALRYRGRLPAPAALAPVPALVPSAPRRPPAGGTPGRGPAAESPHDDTTTPHHTWRPRERAPEWPRGTA
ncbi:3'-5' exonuclease [Streptacidiphilus pinicola]|uniref:3'-5' exonuclease n=1 Tax=Streptacidiphilus pinicola TaxID=2219663 RepID=A0A2X0IFY4_9ACTN|nr:3'-5' exonuclease [Streptacidiphilus pinicola]RAG82533.1 3'-5' exonuclease [Streptacidiphilus pinicola]